MSLSIGERQELDELRRRVAALEAAAGKPTNARTAIQRLNLERRARADRLLEALRELEARHDGPRAMSAKEYLRRLAARPEWQRKLPALRTVQAALAQLRSTHVLRASNG